MKLGLTRTENAIRNKAQRLGIKYINPFRF